MKKKKERKKEEKEERKKERKKKKKTDREKRVKNDKHIHDLQEEEPTIWERSRQVRDRW